MKPQTRNLLLVLAALLPLVALAQTTGAVGSLIKGFSLPQRNADGEIEAQISGEDATVVSPNRTEIRALKVELFEGGKPVTVILSPKCNFWHLDNRLSTTDNVIVKREGIEISAKVMDWEFKEKRGTLRKNVRVVLTNFALSNTPAPSTGPVLQTTEEPAK